MTQWASNFGHHCPYQAYISSLHCLPAGLEITRRETFEGKPGCDFSYTTEPKPDTRLALARFYKANQEHSTNWATRHTTRVLLNLGGYHIRSLRRLLDQGVRERILERAINEVLLTSEDVQDRHMSAGTWSLLHIKHRTHCKKPSMCVLKKGHQRRDTNCKSTLAKWEEHLEVVEAGPDSKEALLIHMGY